MAHSPESAVEAVPGEYTRNWDALGALIAQGKSFSGRERNAAFLNRGTPEVSFATASGALHLDQIDDSRAVIPVDWDRDGDLDLWYANRTGPRLRFLRNDVVAGSRWIALSLEGRTANRDGVGARVELTLRATDGTERTLWRRVRAGDSFLSQTPKTLHFGFREDETITGAVVRWPAPGPPTQVVTGLEPGHHWHLAEGGAPVKRDLPQLTLAAGPAAVPEPPETVRAPLVNRLPVGPLEYFTLQGDKTVLEGSAGKDAPGKIATTRPVLVLFWASWCPRCAREMKLLAARARELAGLRVLALAVDTAKADPEPAAVEDVRRVLASHPWPFDAGFAAPATVRTLATVEARALYPEQALPLPSAYLLDPEGRLAVIYHGPAEIDILLRDAAFATTPPADPEATVFPFPGRSARSLFPTDPGGLIRALRDGGYLDDARSELRRLLDTGSGEHAATRGSWLRQLADLEDEAGEAAAAAAAWTEAIALSPDDPALHLALGASLWRAQRPDDAGKAFARAATLAPSPAPFQNQLGKVWQALGEHARARDAFAASLAAAPGSAETTFNLAVAHQFTGDPARALEGYATALKLDPALLESANNLAWLLATTGNKALRNPPRALTLATKLNQTTRGQSPIVLNTLAAAQAATGDFAAATATATAAITLAHATGASSLITEITPRLESYKKGAAWTE